MTESMILELMIFLIIGGCVGLLSAMFGFGGGIIVVPTLFLCFTYYQHMPVHIVMHIVVGTALSINVINALNSAYSHHRHGDMHYPTVFALAWPIAIGAVIGASIAHFLDSDVLRYLFIAFLFVVIVKALFKKDFTQDYKLSDFTMHKKPVTISVGFFTGILSVLIGIGGSIITLPFLRKAKMPMLNASSAAVALTLSVALVGSLSYITMGLLSHVQLPQMTFGFMYLPAFVGIAAGTFVGVPIGTRISHVMPDNISAKIYIGLLIVVLIAMIV